MFSGTAPLATSTGQKRELEGLVLNGDSPHNVALTSKVLLLAHDGVAQREDCRSVEDLSSNCAGVARCVRKGRHDRPYRGPPAHAVTDRRDTFRSATELEQAIYKWLADLENTGSSML